MPLLNADQIAGRARAAQQGMTIEVISSLPSTNTELRARIARLSGPMLLAAEAKAAATSRQHAVKSHLRVDMSNLLSYCLRLSPPAKTDNRRPTARFPQTGGRGPQLGVSVQVSGFRIGKSFLTPDTRPL